MPNYDPDWVKTYFDAYGMREWQRWDASPVEQVKLAVHLHYLRSLITPDSYILEIGAGAGRFTQELAKILKRIVVADISPGQLQLNRENAQTLDFAASIERWVECDICDLKPHFTDAQFDSVVCYGGPLSYVFGKRDVAIAELLRVTRPGGLLFLGVMSLWGTLHQFLPEVLKLDYEMNKDILLTGDLGPERPEAGKHYCHMYRSAEFRAFLERAGAEIVAMSASDCMTATWAEPLADVQKDDVAWAHLVDMEIEACRQPGCLDMGTHLIAVCRKPRP